MKKVQKNARPSVFLYFPQHSRNILSWFQISHPATSPQQPLPAAAFATDRRQTSKNVIMQLSLSLIFLSGLHLGLSVPPPTTSSLIANVTAPSPLPNQPCHIGQPNSCGAHGHNIVSQNLSCSDPRKLYRKSTSLLTVLFVLARLCRWCQSAVGHYHIVRLPFSRIRRVLFAGPRTRGMYLVFAATTCNDFSSSVIRSGARYLALRGVTSP